MQKSSCITIAYVLLYKHNISERKRAMSYKDMKLFNKLTVAEQNAITREFVLDFPEKQQAQMLKELLLPE